MDANDTINGWVSQTNGRGTLDIIWTCIITISLCCWTSVYANVPAMTDTRWDRFRDRFNLFCLGMLGPEYVFVLAIGQLESARRSVKSFHTAEYSDWNLKKAFFADMGGFVLETPDSLPFPIDAEQLFYLVSKGFLTYPKIDTSEIDDKNKSDSVVRFITVWQVLFFSTTCIARAAQHLAVTTLELTTFGFVFAMLGTSVCWWRKPKDIGRPIILRTDTTIAEILHEAGFAVNDPYECTPLDFVNRQDWFLSIFWTYFTGLLEKLHIPIFSRKIKVRPIDRIRTDNFHAPSPLMELLVGFFMITYSAIFVSAWNFSFPSKGERILWNVSSLTILVFTSFGGLYFYYCDYAYCRKRGREQFGTKTLNITSLRQSSTSENWVKGAFANIRNFLRDRAPQEIPLRVCIPVTILVTLYCLARACILVEDIIGLRSLPSSAFDTVDWSQYLPHF